MTPVTQLPAAELVAEFEHLEQVRGATKLPDDLAARHNALVVELGRRAITAEEPGKKDVVGVFAHNASAAVCALWKAYYDRPREMTDSEMWRVEDLLRAFFMTIK